MEIAPYGNNLAGHFKTPGKSYLGHSHTSSRLAIRPKYNHVTEMNVLYSLPTHPNL